MKALKANNPGIQQLNTNKQTSMTPPSTQLLLQNLRSTLQSISDPNQFNAEQRKYIGILSQILSVSTINKKEKKDTKPNPLTPPAPQRNIQISRDTIKSQSFPMLPMTQRPVILSPQLVRVLKLSTQSLPNPSVFVTAYESYRMRRILCNILFILFRQHPHGVLETQLSSLYKQSFNEEFTMYNDVRYLLSVHKCIVPTITDNRGILYTLNTDEMEFILNELDSKVVSTAITFHIERIFRCFPNGIDCNCFQDLFYHMVQIRLSRVIPCWFSFVQSIPNVYCVHINGLNVFIQIDGSNELKLNENGVGIRHCLINELNINNVLINSYGYHELLLVLFNQHDIDCDGINGKEIERMFYKLYKGRIYYESPFMGAILRNICDIFWDKKDRDYRFKLSKQYRSYLHDRMDDFNAIYQRELTLMNTDEKKEEKILKSPFIEDHCTVFMGGFGTGSTVKKLQRALNKMGITMVTCSGISYRNYGWSFVQLLNPKQCDYLISVSPIYIMGRSIDIRPFIDRQRVDIIIKPSCDDMTDAIREYVNNSSSGCLSIADVQSRLFRQFSYRIDGPQLIKLVSYNPKHFYVSKGTAQKIFNTKYLSENVGLEQLITLINDLWRCIKNEKENEISIQRFENEFGRRYLCMIMPQNFGFSSVKELLDSLQSQKQIAFKIVDEENEKEIILNKIE